MSAGREAAFVRNSQRIALELNRYAVAACEVEIEEQISDRARLDRANELPHRVAIIRGDRGNLGDFKPALPDEFARALFAGESEQARPWRAGFLENDHRAGRIEQEMKFLCADHGSGIFNLDFALANRICPFANQRWIGVVVFAAQAQERLRVDLVQLESFNCLECRRAVGRGKNRVKDDTSLLGLKILAR